MYLNHYWHGLRFMRALIILNISDVLVYLRIITTSSAIRLTQLGSIFFTVVSIEHFLEGSALLRQWYVPLSVPSSLSIFAPKYLLEYKDTYFILQNKYLCIYKDSFAVNILRDDCALIGACIHMKTQNSYLHFSFSARNEK